MQLQLLPALLLLALATVSAQAFVVSFSAEARGRASGAVLVLDCSSLWKKHPTQPQISISDAAACQQRCANLPGCTAFAFCKDKGGCGSGCSSHVAKNPSVSAVALESSTTPNKRGERLETSSVFKLPITAFGPYTPHEATKGCDPARPDKWAFGTCTLLAGAGGGKTAPAAEGAGWVSAWLTKPVPRQCNKLSAAACAACFAGPDSGACLSCMTDKRATSYVVDVALIADGTPADSTGSRTLDQCATCSKLGSKAAQQQCTSCVLNASACSSCVSYPGAATQLPLAALAPCMSCVEGKGKRFTGACLTCAVVADPSKCITCLDGFFPQLTCRTAAYEDCYKPDWDNPCATCQRAAPGSYQPCIACYGRPKSKADCDSCAAVGTAAAQKQCFACSAKVLATSSGTPGGCGGCFTHSRSPASLTQCLSCVGGDATAPGLRQHCSLCSAPGLSDAQAARCFKCLAGKGGSAACAVCSASASSDAAFAACLACRADPANGPDCRDCDSLSTGSALPADGEALRKKCYDCVVGSKLVVPTGAGAAALGSCQACFSVPGADAGRCVACNTNPLVPTLAKSWCVACAGKPAVQREACIKCLASNSKLGSAADVSKQCNV